ncbi:hypothetical protein [Verminephrobacter eiseniae]|uniref:hypothetical protein n=1 Tax=Verminephrobacter eiseniae TaxID=364317 RepID=UPI002238E30D|nr:hypothetical protein [Verminephrobacter eiseniae]
MARNRSLDRHTVLAMENATDLRIPGMRRSKFLLPHTLADTVFGATRRPLANHEWCLRAVGLAPGDYIGACCGSEDLPNGERPEPTASAVPPPRARHQRRRHALHFLALHMHSTAAGELLMLRSPSFPLAAPAARKPPVRHPRCPCCPSRRLAHV